jgi:hypothetical protein
MARQTTIEGLDQFEQDLDEYMSTERIWQHFVEAKGDEIIRVVIAAAHAGIGEDGRGYTRYSPQYKARKTKTQGSALGNWLRGLDRTGNVGGMLDKSNFSWEIKGGSLWLVWTAPDEQTGIYAEAHQKGLGNMPKRLWLHFSATQHIRAVETAFDQTIRELAAEFTAQWT